MPPETAPPTRDRGHDGRLEGFGDIFTQDAALAPGAVDLGDVNVQRPGKGPD